jgi:glycosyltransferase involved in cell wall biosynthesis
VLGEAMAMGLPCVTTDVGDAAVLVADTGIVVPRANPEALAHGVGELIARGPAYYRQLGQQARERIHAAFTMDCMRKRFEGIYDSVMNGRRV